MMPGSNPGTTAEGSTDEGAAFAGTVDEIVAALDQDPILVEEVMGNGHTQAIHEALSAKAAQSPVPVYVVLTQAPAGLTTDNKSEELLSLLRARSEKDGVWFVATSDIGHTELAVYGVDLGTDNDETLLSGATRQANDDAVAAIRDECSDCHGSPALNAGVLLDVLAAGVPEEYRSPHPLTDAQIDSYATSTWWTADTQTAYYERAEMPTPGLYAVVATATALTVAVVGYRLLQAIGGHAHPRIGAPADAGAPTPQPPADPARDLERWQARAETEVRKLARGLERTGDTLAWERRDVASACLERAEARTASPDPLEVIGALVLARTGRYALTRPTGQYRCCYVDPRHGEAQTEAPLGGGTRVPVCKRCADALAKDKPLAPLTAKGRFGSLAPYYERSSVWARTGFGSLGGAWWQDVPR